jgi:hypothetical protein
MVGIVQKDWYRTQVCRELNIDFGVQNNKIVAMNAEQYARFEGRYEQEMIEGISLRGQIKSFASLRADAENNLFRFQTELKRLQPELNDDERMYSVFSKLKSSFRIVNRHVILIARQLVEAYMEEEEEWFQSQVAKKISDITEYVEEKGFLEPEMLNKFCNVDQFQSSIINNESLMELLFLKDQAAKHKTNKSTISAYFDSKKIDDGTIIKIANEQRMRIAKKRSEILIQRIRKPPTNYNPDFKERPKSKSRKKAKNENPVESNAVIAKTIAEKSKVEQKKEQAKRELQDEDERRASLAVAQNQRDERDARRASLAAAAAAADKLKRNRDDASISTPIDMDADKAKKAFFGAGYSSTPKASSNDGVVHPPDYNASYNAFSPQPLLISSDIDKSFVMLPAHFSRISAEDDKRNVALLLPESSDALSLMIDKITFNKEQRLMFSKQSIPRSLAAYVLIHKRNIINFDGAVIKTCDGLSYLRCVYFLIKKQPIGNLNITLQYDEFVGFLLQSKNKIKQSQVSINGAMEYIEYLDTIRTALQKHLLSKLNFDDFEVPSQALVIFSEFQMQKMYLFVLNLWQVHDPILLLSTHPTHADHYIVTGFNCKKCHGRIIYGSESLKDMKEKCRVEVTTCNAILVTSNYRFELVHIANSAFDQIDSVFEKLMDQCSSVLITCNITEGSDNPSIDLADDTFFEIMDTKVKLSIYSTVFSALEFGMNKGNGLLLQKIKKHTVNKNGVRYQVHFLGYESRFDEFVNENFFNNRCEEEREIFEKYKSQNDLI